MSALSSIRFAPLERTCPLFPQAERILHAQLAASVTLIPGGVTHHV